MQKIVKLNRAFLYCCMVVIFCLHFKGYAAAPTQGKPVSITIKNSSLAEVLRQVSKKSGLYIYFQDADLAGHKNVTIDVKNKPVENVLHELLDGRGFSWVEVSENTIAVKKNEFSEKDKIVDTSTTSIRGLITDEKGYPLPGVNVLIKGSKQGAATASDGSFVITNVRNSSDVVIISMVGYETIEQRVPNNKMITVSLKFVSNILDETIVIAYGTTTKRYSSGNVTTIKGADIQKQPISNPLLALQGRVPGLLLTQSSGVSGTGVTVRIQGQNSINNGNDPFYVIDGVPFTSQLLPSLGSILGNSGTNAVNGAAVYGNPLSFINPQDIESIEVLKDADATSIYGSRAANGAILITTKKGNAGKTKINLSFQSGISQVAKKIKLLNEREYLELRREGKINDGEGITSEDYDINGFWDTTRVTDWQKELIGKTATFNDLEVSISGGNVNTNFRLGGGYHRETSVFPGNFSDARGSAHFSINHASENRKFNIQFTGSYLSDNNRLPTTDLTNIAITLAPNAPKLFNGDQSLNWMPTSTGTSTWLNPLAYVNRSYQNKTQNLIANSIFSYELLNGLILKTSFGYNSLESDEVLQNKSLSIKPENRAILPRTGQYSDNKLNSWIIEPQINYTRKIGNGKFDALAGLTFQNNSSDGQILTGIGYNSDQVIGDIRSAGQVTANSTINSLYKYNAVFIRANYISNDRYIVNLTARRDGSSRFGAKNKFHNFGSIGAAWIFSNEKQVKSFAPWLEFGKLRVSYGTTGNDQIGDYRYLNLYQSTGDVLPYQGISGLFPVGLANEYLQWEQVKKFQVGIDLAIFKEKITLTSTYYRNRSNNQLLNFSLPSLTGFKVIAGNFPALVQNDGWEFAITSINTKKRYFSWNTSFNITIPRNKLLKFDNLSSSSFSDSYVIGMPITLRKSYDFQGVDAEQGTYLFKNNKGELTGTPSSETDRSITQNTAPTYYGGVQNTFNLYGFQLDFLIQFVKQLGDNINFGNFIPGIINSNQPSSIKERWRHKGDVSSVQRSNSNYSLFDSYYNALSSNAAYTDASFLRLKTLSLSWQIPQIWLSNHFVTSGNIYIRAQNLFTISKYSGLDPETRSSISLPPLRVITFGLQIAF